MWVYTKNRRPKEGDTVRVYNGYEYMETVVTKHDLNLDSAPYGLHNERASLTHKSFGYEPEVWVDPETTTTSSDEWKCVVPINVTVTDLEYDDGIVSFDYDPNEVSKQLGKYILKAVKRAAEEALDES